MLPSRAQLHQQFVQAFADNRSATPVPLTELDHLATVLGTALPSSYREFILRFGALQRQNPPQPSGGSAPREHGPRAFFTPRDVLRRSEELWCQCLPVDLYVFAGDDLGNGFCFRKSRAPIDDAPVMFLTRQSESLFELYAGFDAMLQAHLARRLPMAAFRL